MAIQEMELDPNAQSYTDDEIVGKVNTAAVDITRAGSVDAAARPIEAGEVGATQLADEAYTTTEKTKLTGVEANATVDQTGAEIKTAYEGEANAYTDTKDTKLTGIEAGADANVGEEFSTAEQTKLTGIDAGAEVNPADLAALDSAQDTKLNGIETGAKDDQTGAEVRDAIVALADTDRKLVISDPQTGEFKVVSVQRKSTGKLGSKYDDVAV